MRKLLAVAGAALVALGVLAVTVFAKSSPHAPVAPALRSTATQPAISAATGTPPVHAPIPQTRITIVSGNVSVSRGVAHLRLSCQMGEAIRLTCRGTLSLHALSGALLGRSRFAIPNCCSAPWHVVAVHVNLGGRSLPARARAQAVLDRNAASGTQTVRLVGSA